MQGLPGSGKSTYAKDLVSKNPGKYKRICKDDLRAMLDNSKWSRTNEEFVLNIRDEILRQALVEGKDVIIDDTNFEQKHIDRIKDIAKEYAIVEKQQINVEVKFIDTPLQECIENDLNRFASVGKDVIVGMWKKYLKKPQIEVPYIDELPRCIIVDIDGTLAIHGDRSPYDWGRVGEDRLNGIVYQIVKKYWEVDLILVSGRDSVCREATETWLQFYGVRYKDLFMRPEGNTEKDTIIKERIYREHIEGKYNVLFVLDDRDQVVQMWRDLGLTCLQVANGDF